MSAAIRQSVTAYELSLATQVADARRQIEMLKADLAESEAATAKALTAVIEGSRVTERLEQELRELTTLAHRFQNVRTVAERDAVLATIIARLIRPPYREAKAALEHLEGVLSR